MGMRDRLLAMSVAAMWGCNFLAIHAMIGHFPPLFACALRFAVIAVPAVLLVPRPRVPLRWLVGYGLGFGTCQFGFLFVGMRIGMPTGLASLVLQASAPLTVLLAAALLRERVSPRQLGGIGLAVAGMAVIAWQQAERAALLPVLLTLLGALSWAAGNLCNRKAMTAGAAGGQEPGGRGPNPLHLTLWMCAVPPLPMLAVSLAVEGGAGWHAVATALTPGGLLGLAGLAYIVAIGTVAGSGIWTTLMRRHPAGMVAPFSLLVPVVGMTLAFLLLDERPTAVQAAAAVVVVVGVLLGCRPPAGAAAGATGGADDTPPEAPPALGSGAAAATRPGG
jgi:O-acetylserine/cysteine efflux transporter